MKHKLLGRSGLRVSEFCLGAMTFGGGKGTLGGAGSSDEESRAVFDTFAEAGGTFIDTAISYSMGASEELLGDFLQADRDHFVVATKYGNSPSEGLMLSGNSRRNMMLSVEKSLKRLRTDRIDLYWLHVWDYTTPVEEVMRGFDDLVRSGKVLYVGLSDTPSWEVSRANMMADLLNMAPVTAIQVERNLLNRSTDHDMLPMARKLDLAVTAWSPLAGGALARPLDTTGRRSARILTPREQEIVKAVHEIAAELDATPAQVAIAALRHDPSNQQVFPIVGATRAEQLRDVLKAADLVLQPQQFARLEELSKPDLIFPYSVTDTALGKRITHGGEYDNITNHRRQPGD